VGVWIGSWWWDGVVSNGDSASVDVVAKSFCGIEVVLRVCFH
jgi:hypothetical protein